MSKILVSLCAVAALTLFAAGPVFAFGAGIGVPKTATSSVDSGSTSVSATIEDGHAPGTFEAADCKAAQRTFWRRNTTKPSIRREAIANCDAEVASTPPSN